MHSMIFPLIESAGFACPTALFLKVHHRTCGLLGLILDFIVILSSCSWTVLGTLWVCFKVANSNANFVMVDYVMEMAVKNFCNYDEYGSVEHLLHMILDSFGSGFFFFFFFFLFYGCIVLFHFV